MAVKFIMVVFSLMLFVSGMAQNGTEKTDLYEEAYQKRIQKTTINGVYIPKDITDCFIQLNRLTDEQSRIKFKNMSEEDASRKLHFSLGRWMIYNWSFYEGSRLSYYLTGLGISSPDDMAQFIIILYHRNLNRNKLNVKELVEQYEAKKQLKIEERRKNGTIIHEEKRKREKKNDE